MKKTKMMMIAAMVVMMVLPTSLSAQSLFGRRENGQNRYMLKNDESVYGLMNNTNRAVFTGTNEPGLGNQGFTRILSQLLSAAAYLC